MIACCGALAGIGLAGLLCSLLSGNGAHVPLLVAPMGASAVLLFAVPASPLAQPWPIIGGNTISALVGVAVGRYVPEPMLATGIAVALAIAAMSLTRCLHPPGGAAALTVLLGGPPVTGAGFTFALMPICLNSVILVALGWLFHRLSGHAYPHVARAAPANLHGTRDLPPQLRVGFRGEDVDAALADLHETFDIDRDDLDRLLRQVEVRAFARAHGNRTCAEIMSRDVVAVGPDAAPGAARALLLDHGIRTLPVVDKARHIVGSVGLRELAAPCERVAEVMTTPFTARPDSLAADLIALLTDGKTHAVAIVDANRHILGLVTQTDLLVALSTPSQVMEAAVASAAESG